jgi:pimeloyl-ACP methyl ester carboxylesterase
MGFLDRNILVDGVRLAYRDRGQGEPVVFVHGTPSYSYEWREVVPHVENAGYRVITYDLLGYGDSERPLDRDTSVGGQTELLIKLLEELGLGQPSLITHDIGGAIGQRIAVQHSSPRAPPDAARHRQLRLLALRHLAEDHPREAGQLRRDVRLRVHSPAHQTAADGRRERGQYAGRAAGSLPIPAPDGPWSRILLRTPGSSLRLEVHQRADPARST